VASPFADDRSAHIPQNANGKTWPVSGVPRKVWCWFRRADSLHRDNLSVRLDGEADISAFKRRAWLRGYRILKTWEVNGGRDISIRLARPPHQTIVQAMLDVEMWPGVKFAGAQRLYVY
jgi:hypothetical protein